MKEPVHNVKKSTEYKREHKADYGRERIEILYEDSDIVVIDKPSGMLSVPYPGSRARTALDVLEKILRSRGELSRSHKPLTVHRLDRDTSGVMMFALNESVQHKIMASWQKMVTGRIYHAVAENPSDKKLWLPDSGLIDDPLAKNARHVGYVPSEKEKVETVEARTNYSVVLRGETHTLFELELDTGKKNQIRAHLASKKYPLAGDENFRSRTDPFHRLALHARTLEFTHPVTGKNMRFEVPEPEEWIEYVKKGDRHPEKTLWADNYGAGGKSQKKIEEMKLPKDALHSAGKNRRKMDFISRGKQDARRR